MVMARRVTIQGRGYPACAVCQRPLVKGYGVCFPVQQVGASPLDPLEGSKQALCREDYLDQFKEVYPDASPPYHLPNNLLTMDSVRPLMEELELLTHNQRGDLDVVGTDPALLDQAVQLAAASNWAESVRQVYDRLSERVVPDVEMVVPIHSANDGGQAQGVEMLVEIQRQNALLEIKLAAQLGCSRDELWSLLGDTTDVEAVADTVQAGLTADEMDAVQIVSTPSRLSRLSLEEQATVRDTAQRVMDRIRESV